MNEPIRFRPERAEHFGGECRNRVESAKQWSTRSLSFEKNTENENSGYKIVRKNGDS